MKVLVVVLNYRTPELAVRCLTSLEHEVHRRGDMRVVVTDNDSGDDSVDRIGAAIEKNGWDWCELIPLPKNGGYCFGNNAGIRPSLQSDDPPDYVILMNPDAHIKRYALSNLVDFMEEHPEAGIAGSRLEDEDGTQQNGAFRFPNATTETLDGFRLGVLTNAFKERDLRYDHLGDDPVPVDWVVGASMIIRKEVFDDVGLLDESYFLYFDEVDFCLRAHRAGWKAYHVPSSVVVHLEGAATDIMHRRSKPSRFPTYWFDSRRRFFVKNYGKLHALLADLGFLVGYSTFRIRRVLQRKPDDDPPRFWWDFLRNSTLVKGFRL